MRNGRQKDWRSGSTSLSMEGEAERRQSMRQRRRDTRREAWWQTHRAQMQCKESQATIWHGEGQKSRTDQVHCRDATNQLFS